MYFLGTKMHIDPEWTDAFNALIRGEKWWVSLPKDLYEFNDQFTCNQQCSDPLNNFHREIGVWFIHILPQIRYKFIITNEHCFVSQALAKYDDNY